MPQHLLIGRKNRHLVKGADYDETRVTFEDISMNPKMEQIIKPNQQGSLDDNKVDSMIQEYLEHPHFLKFKNRIIIAILNKKWYLVDGQHRIEMAQRCYIENSKNDEFTFCWFYCNEEQQMRQLFSSLNKDSIKNEMYINTDDRHKYMIDIFMDLFKTNYQHLFNKSKKDNSRIFSIQEIRDKLIQIKYFESFNHAKECYLDLIQKNNEFFNLCNYDKDIHYGNIDNYYKDDQSRIHNKFIIPCKNCKFLDWLQTNDNIYLHHQQKKLKKPISKGIKEKVWFHEFNNQLEGICPISRCQTILKKSGKGGFQAGHIVSEYNGGKTEFMNLRPICANCNQSMGNKNWCDYDSLSCNITIK